MELQHFISTLDKSSLPRVLQVCSGIYFQGSVYELAGSEVCLSTGDLIQVLATELISMSCENIRNHETFELPISHKGLFQLVPDETYSTLGELLALRTPASAPHTPISFVSHSELRLGRFILEAWTVLHVRSVEQGKAWCLVRGQQGASARLAVPLSCPGEFSELRNDQSFTLRQIVDLPELRSRRFICADRPVEATPLLLRPIYQILVKTSLTNETLRFNSSLDVEVVDVTQQFKDALFTSPLSLTALLSEPDEAFPAIAEIVQGAETKYLLHCSWLQELRRGQRLVLHRKGPSAMALFSSTKCRNAKRYLLVSQHYGGRFRRRPREFHSVYEVYAASLHAPGLAVSVTMQSEDVEGFPCLSVGERLEVLRCETLTSADAGDREEGKALVCRHLKEPSQDDDDEEDEDAEREELVLPLYMQCNFVENMTVQKKYTIKDLCQDFALPLNVKVVTRDPGLETDPLFGFPSLRLEAPTVEPVVQASLADNPQLCFLIPTRWLSMSIIFTKHTLPWPVDQCPECQVDSVTEVMEAVYYESCIRTEADGPPPPRPPKRNPSSSLTSTEKTPRSPRPYAPSDAPAPPTCSSILNEGLSNLTLICNKRQPPPPPVILNDNPPPIKSQEPGKVKTAQTPPNAYEKFNASSKSGTCVGLQEDDDGDHDYETPDHDYETPDHDYETPDHGSETSGASLLEMLRRTQETVRFYPETNRGFKSRNLGTAQGDKSSS